jgi:uncharacterized protein YacL
MNLLRLHALPDVRLVFDAREPVASDADQDLLLLAQQDRACLLTNDSELQNIARERGVRILSTHELENSLQRLAVELMAFFGSPEETAEGDVVNVRIVRKGKPPRQGVAYIANRQIVFVEGAGDYVGQHVEIRITSVRESSPGRLTLFAVLAAANRMGRLFHRLPPE